MTQLRRIARSISNKKRKKHTHITQKVKIYSEIQTQNHITRVAQIEFIMLINFSS